MTVLQSDQLTYYFLPYTSIEVEKKITQSQVQFYLFKWLDTSAISLFDFSETFETYGQKQPQTIYYYEDSKLTILWEQSRERPIIQFTVQSLDIVLGLVGGLSSIVWGFLAIIFGDYETFKLQNSLIGAIYPLSPPKKSNAEDEDDVQPVTEAGEAKLSLVRTAAEPSKYTFNFREYILSNVIKLLVCKTCCCCLTRTQCYIKRIKRLQRHKEATERLTEEMDIQTAFKIMRLANFMAKLNLKKHQRALVPSFSKYRLENLERKKDVQENEVRRVENEQQFLFDGPTAIQDEQHQSNESSLMTYLKSDLFEKFWQSNRDHFPQLKQLIEEIDLRFDPDGDIADVGILYEITGFQGAIPSGAASHDFWDAYNDFSSDIQE